MPQTVAILGGGVAGLSAAWRLQKKGFDQFVVLEMNADAGGNSRWGENGTSAYPWGAHYVPVPGKQAVYVRELFSDLGVLKPDGTWEERYLCFAPQERLFLHGRWQEGIEPAIGLTAGDRDQFRRGVGAARVPADRTGGALLARPGRPVPLAGPGRRSVGRRRRRRPTAGDERQIDHHAVAVGRP